jgi:glutamyl-Q tRNA(Asp) synthetase
VRLEDVDTPRCVPGAAETILAQLAACHLLPDAPPLYQSARGVAYQAALDTLLRHGDAYPCGCTRKEIEGTLAAQNAALQRNTTPRYPGTCRNGLHGKPARAWRLRLPDDAGVTWHDRRLGPQTQDVAASVGDFVLRRADGLWAYQLAVVVDDAAQGITHVVRGEDLADNTPRQMLLQRALALAAPQYLHTPLVLADDGEKLSKQNGAMPLDTRDPPAALNRAAAVLGLAPHAGPASEALAAWVEPWRHRYPSRSPASLQFGPT